MRFQKNLFGLQKHTIAYRNAGVSIACKLRSRRFDSRSPFFCLDQASSPFTTRRSSTCWIWRCSSTRIRTSGASPISGHGLARFFSTFKAFINISLIVYFFRKYTQWQCILSYDNSTAMYKFLKTLHRNSNPGSSALLADAMTAMPRRPFLKHLIFASTHTGNANKVLATALLPHYYKTYKNLTKIRFYP
jgi:hypothetical protein